MKKVVVKIIDYNFQHTYQLTEAYDDSNSMRYLGRWFDIYVIGRYNCKVPMVFKIEDKFSYTDYTVIFLPSFWHIDKVMEYVVLFNPHVIHMHGNHGWPQYPIYASYFKYALPGARMIFSPAGSSCGKEEFLKNFDVVIVNHPDQIRRMRCPASKVIVRNRCADPSVFHPISHSCKEYDFVYVAGFVPQKRIDVMISQVLRLDRPRTLVIFGDFSRTTLHFSEIKNYINKNDSRNQISVRNFVPQAEVADFLSKCKVWVWPNIKPENPETTTNRAVGEALACGMPLLVGENAFKNTHYVLSGKNGFLYNDKDFEEKSEVLLKNYESFGQNSYILSRKEFSFYENFVEFYKDLYGL